MPIDQLSREAEQRLTHPLTLRFLDDDLGRRFPRIFFRGRSNGAELPSSSAFCCMPGSGYSTATSRNQASGLDHPLHGRLPVSCAYWFLHVLRSVSSTGHAARPAVSVGLCGASLASIVMMSMAAAGQILSTPADPRRHVRVHDDLHSGSSLRRSCRQALIVFYNVMHRPSDDSTRTSYLNNDFFFVSPTSSACSRDTRSRTSGVISCKRGTMRKVSRSSRTDHGAHGLAEGP